MQTYCRDFLHTVSSIDVYISRAHLSQVGFPSGSADEEFACNAGDVGSFPGLRSSPGEGNSYPLQYSGPPTISLSASTVCWNDLTFFIWGTGKGYTPGMGVGFVYGGQKKQTVGDKLSGLLFRPAYPCPSRTNNFNLIPFQSWKKVLFFSFFLEKCPTDTCMFSLQWKEMLWGLF